MHVNLIWDLDKWLLKTGGPLIQVAFITGSTVLDCWLLTCAINAAKLQLYVLCQAAALCTQQNSRE